MHRLLTLPALVLALTVHAQARLGETEDQNEDRYGLPKRQFDQDDKRFPIIQGEGSRTKTYLFQTYRIRIGYLNGVAVRIEYLRQFGQKDMTLKDFEKAAIFEAESAGGKWRPDAAGMEQASGYVAGRNVYVREDGARASCNVMHVLFEAKTILDLEAAHKAEAAKQEAARKADDEKQRRAGVPNF